MLLSLRYSVCFEEDGKFVKKRSEFELQCLLLVFRRICKTSKCADYGSLLPHLGKWPLSPKPVPLYILC